MSLHELYNRAVSTAILLLCTVYWTVLIPLFEVLFCIFAVRITPFLGVILTRQYLGSFSLLKKISLNSFSELK